jgi:cell wall-associated NlpC family hydrolase
MRKIKILSVALLIFSLSSCAVFKKNNSKSSTAAISKERREIVSFAKKQMGAAYKYAGKSPATGFDCSGFTSYVLQEFDVKISPGSSEQAKAGKKIPLDETKPGDLIFFGDETRIQHVALVYERKKDGIYCIHSTSSRGVVIDNISTSTYWKPRILYAKNVVGK